MKSLASTYNNNPLFSEKLNNNKYILYYFNTIQKINNHLSRIEKSGFLSVAAESVRPVQRFLRAAAHQSIIMQIVRKMK